MRTIAALTCCLLVAALLGAPAVSGTPSTHSPTGSVGGDLAALQSDDAANVTHPETIEITIQPDGDARFVLSKEFPTATENQSAAFERLAGDFENGEYGRLGFSTYQSIVDDVAAQTGREMSLVDAGPHTNQSGDVGRLEYRFTWTNFAADNEANVSVGDAFRTDDGLWLDGLSDGQRLVIRAPDGYGVAESPSGPEIDDNALIWTGPATFAPGDLQVTFEESAGGSTLPTTALLALVVLLVVGMVVVAGWWARSERADGRSIGDRIGSFLPEREPAPNGGDAVADAGADSGPSDSGGSATAQSAEDGGTTAVADAEPSPAADTADTANATDGEQATDAVDPELLSDGERVEHLLEENGGRMKQANIVSETGWSNAKVSQLLSRLDEEERVDKLRIGRENLITLPDVDVTDKE